MQVYSVESHIKLVRLSLVSSRAVCYPDYVHIFTTDCTGALKPGWPGGGTDSLLFP